MPHQPIKPRHDHATLKFPQGFLWGAATSAFQVEGNNQNSDWWEWEQNQPSHLRSGLAANQYQLFQEDFRLAQKLGHNAHRLSLEWSRIEPEEGRFDPQAIAHYLKVLQYLKSLKIKVMLTLHHFSNPLWLTKKGGWVSLRSSSYFARFVERVVPEFKDHIDLWITINEPGVYAYCAYSLGKFPPQRKNELRRLLALWNLCQAHKAAYRIIHRLDPQAQVGLSQNVTSYTTFHKHNLPEFIVQWIYDLFSNHLVYFLTGKTHDFLGLNYYFNQYISLNSRTILPQPVDITASKKEVSDMGWEIYPEGIFEVLTDLADYHLPIYITENGLASVNDDRRVRFLLSYLKEVYHAIQSGVKVKGYFHWSLIDNYEWTAGFKSRFGLIQVDFKTQRRTIRPSAQVYQQIIKSNGIPHYLLKLLGHGSQVKEVLANPHDL